MAETSRNARILMVDDRAENLLALEAILHGLGHELVKASSGEEALKRLLTEEFALILLDVQMPGMDGFETATRIKQRERTRDIPILFLTAIDGEAHQAFRGYAAGAVDYLSKPFDPWVLRAKVGVFLELHERRRELLAQAEELHRLLATYSGGGVERAVAKAIDALALAQTLADEQSQPALAKAIADAADAVASVHRLVASATSTAGFSASGSGASGVAAP
ncbi:MAG TPA: response regulator [Acidothermaceae bacterium]|nr:response regulator [Acidothermaceae bacterium]